MELANQAMYLGFGLIFLGLSFGSLHDLRHQFSLQSSKHYWVFSLLAMSLSCFFFLIYPLVGGLALTLANVTQFAANMGLVILFRSFNTKITKGLLLAFLISLPLFGLVFELTRAKEAYDIRIEFLSGVAIALAIWQMYEVSVQYLKSRSIYLGFLILAVAGQIALWIYRIWTVDHYADFIGHASIFDEHLPEFIARLIVIVLYALIFIAIGNYFYDQLVARERERREDKEEQMLVALKSLASARDNDTGNHIVRTQRYVKVLAERLKFMGYHPEQLDTKKVNAIYRAAPLHDIGKVGIPDSILLKAGPLNFDEWGVMKTHAAIGESVLEASAANLKVRDEVIESAILIAGGHHEKWDGTGYPRGLSGENIPLDARIMALADMYDALVTSRPYKSAWSHDEAIEEIVNKKGTHLDPTVVDAFIAEEDSFKAIANRYRD
ncbi:HD domain-containing protein [Polynucleobacter sp. 71A-WALBACH]|uniref:HD-GYP domain-containing protein n=1 Tax=Polynucleobacter sp. 71A-WALBACH TaxID=2689097 RepID=UPI001C0E3A9B|nr:HD domain-containing phosphohydrolase [Polynucleobacter sp. 71A-WALBACH]MBU3593670.1 HD domain-containing protein [Polynucleobacter sp. 71A-WALBACH]